MPAASVDMSQRQVKMSVLLLLLLLLTMGLSPQAVPAVAASEACTRSPRYLRTLTLGWSVVCCPAVPTVLLLLVL